MSIPVACMSWRHVAHGSCNGVAHTTCMPQDKIMCIHAEIGAQEEEGDTHPPHEMGSFNFHICNRLSSWFMWNDNNEGDEMEMEMEYGDMILMLLRILHRLFRSILSLG